MLAADLFSWIIDGKIGGMPKPDVFGSLEQNLQILSQKYNIKTILSLTEYQIDKNAVLAHGMNYFHFPIDDFTAPSLAQFQEFEKIYTMDNFPIAVHCFAGMGRTGTILAAALLIEGYSPEDAISKVRSLRPGSIENDMQIESIRSFYDYLTK